MVLYYTMVFDSPNTSLLYTLSYVWRNPILVFEILDPLLFFESKYHIEIIRNLLLTVIYVVYVNPRCENMRNLDS